MELWKAVYDMNWHLLPLQEKKKFVFFLQHVQQIKCIKLIGSKVLNLETGMAVRKKTLFLDKKNMFSYFS